MLKAIATLFSLLLGSCFWSSETHAQTKPPSSHVKSGASAHSTLQEEEKLRIRLHFYPHDAASHSKLIELLKNRYGFRAIVNAEVDWLKDNPGDWLALIDLTSTSEAALNDPEFSIAQIRSFLSHTSREADSELYDNEQDQLANKLEKRGHTTEASEIYADLVRRNPNDSGLWAGYGDTLSASGRHSDAVKALRHAVELDPSDEFLHRLLAEGLLASGDTAGAETEYKAALSLYESLYKKGQSDDSLARKLIKIQADNHQETLLAATHLKLAHVLLAEKKYDEAVVHTRLALEADQYEFIAFYVRASIYDAKGDSENARKAREDGASAIAREAAKERSPARNSAEPSDPRIAFLTDELWNEHPGYPALPAEIVSILETRSTSLSTVEHVALATAYFALNKIPEAKRQWEKAIENDPKADTAASHANLGRELVKAGALRDALPHLRRAYELDPQNLTYRTEYDALREKIH